MAAEEQQDAQQDETQELAQEQEQAQEQAEEQEEEQVAVAVLRRHVLGGSVCSNSSYDELQDK